jgi:dTDP-4-amino-4,6-dideoxygalactose transaminase
MDEVHAAVLRVKLPHLDEWNGRRRRVAAAYFVGLKDAALRLPQVNAFAEPVWHQFVVESERRDQLQASLQAKGIATQIHYPLPPHVQGAYAGLNLGEGTFPRTERLHREVLSLPMGPHVTEGESHAVIEAVLRA